MNYSHKLSLTALFALLVSLFALSGCQGDKPRRPSEPADVSALSFEVRMPQAIGVEGIRGGLVYYWDEDLVLSYDLTQDGKKPLSGKIKPKSINKDGTAADFELPLPKEAGFEAGKSLTMKAVLRAEGGESEYAPKAITSDKIGGTLPFDLLGSLPMSFSVEHTQDLDGKPISLPSRALQSIFLVQILNGTEETLAPKALKLTSDKGDPFYLEFPESAPSVSPDFTQSYLIRIPASDPALGNVKAELAYRTGDEEETKSLASAEGLNLKDNTKPLFLTVQKESLGFTSAPEKAEADTKKGGDPLFSMNDITYWIGEGSKRAALIIEWHLTEGGDAYVWGYRFEGEQSTADMLMAIVQADPRLSLAGIYTSFGLSPSAIAYQAGEEVTDPKPAFVSNGEKLPNDGKGFTELKTYDIIDALVFEDETAIFRTGWLKNGYWSYHSKDTRLDPFQYMNVGISGHTLVDGGWDALSFQIGWESWSGNPPGKKFRPATAPEE